jgi:hypothetical protein
MRELWGSVATLLFFVLCASAIGGAIWFAVVNFGGDERKHPLDYFSNKLRSRPHVFFLTVAALVACALLPVVMGINDEMAESLPGLAAVIYGLGLAIFCKVSASESTAAGLMALLLYAPTSFFTVLIIMSPMLTESWAGWMYSNMYLAAHLFWVLWLRANANRRKEPSAQQDPDEEEPSLNCCQRCCRVEVTDLLPKGSDKLTLMWEKAVYFTVPLLLVVSNLMNLFMYCIEEGENGWAAAMAFWMIACSLLAGCCLDYRAGTEVEM